MDRFADRFAGAAEANSLVSEQDGAGFARILKMLGGSDIAAQEKGAQPQTNEAPEELNKLDVPSAVKAFLFNIGEDPSREGLIRTPDRFAKALRFLTEGYTMSLDAVVHGAIFNVPGSDLVVVRDIDIFSLCEHHMLPFTGKIHIGYIPNGRVIGLSKLARIAEMFSRRLQVQERLTEQVAHAVDDVLKPAGVAVVVEASHMCMAMRGVRRTGAVTTTECAIGEFRTDEALHRRFLSMLR